MLIVTHQVPDLDAIGAIWMLTRFDAQTYSGSRVAFVNAGETLSPATAAALGYTPDQVTHVDTGLGPFDHHFPERAGKEYCATSLTYHHVVKVHPDLATDQALQLICEHVCDIDHFGEAFWPDANHPRYAFMLHEIIDAMDATDTNDDQSQVDLGCRLFDFVYAAMKRHLQAINKLADGIIFPLQANCTAFAVETSNESVLATAQKAGHCLTISKDPQAGNIRIKARPDAPFDLQAIYQEILQRDQTGTWYYHPSGKMVLNGSKKRTDHIPSPLTLSEIVTIIKKHL